MPDAHKNFIITTVATAPSPATSGTSLVVSAGFGANFPAAPFNMTVWPPGVQPSLTNAEIARVTARSGDTLTIQRAQEATTARSIQVGDQIAMTITAKSLTDIESAMMTKAVYDPQNAGYISGANNSGTGGSLKMDGGSGGVVSGGNVFTHGASASGGAVLTYGGSNSGAAGGSILTYGSTSRGGIIATYGQAGQGGNISTRGGTDAGGRGGEIGLDGGSAPGARGGDIISKGGNGTGASGGDINMSGATGGGTGNGGSIDTRGSGFNPGGNINTSNGGGSINTSNGGGSIDTRGTGSIKFGVAATRTTVQGSATTARTQTLPDKDGTFAMTSDVPANFLKAWVNFNAATSFAVAATYARTSPSNVITVTCAGHGQLVGHIIWANMLTGAGFTSGNFAVGSVIDANTFTFVGTATTTVSGTMQLLRRTVRASAGVNDVAPTGTGGINYVNFSTAFVDANYCVSGWAAGSASGIGICTGSGGTSMTAATCQVNSINNTAFAALPTVCASFFR